MENQNLQKPPKYKAPVKVSLILKGPVKGVCDIPIGTNAQKAETLLSKNDITEILDKSFKHDVMMFVIILPSMSDIYDEAIFENISFISEKVNEYGGILSLNIPLSSTNSVEDVVEFKKFIVKKVHELQVDLLTAYFPKKVFNKVGKEIGNLFEELILAGFHNARIYTDFPTDKDELAEATIKCIMDIKEACNFIDNVTVGFIIKNENEFNLEAAKSLEMLQNIHDFNYLVLPSPPFCSAEKLDGTEKIHLPFGICSFNNASLVINEKGSPVYCLDRQDINLPALDKVLDTWSTDNHPELTKIEECSTCSHVATCEGLCRMWHKIMTKDEKTEFSIN